MTEPSRFWRSIFRKPLPKSDGEGPEYVRSNFFLHLHPPFIKKEHLKLKHSFCLGGLSFLLFLITGITGIILMLYYVPTASGAHASIRDIENAVSFGSFIRALHKYAAELMLITVFLHMLRVIWHRAYRAPREFNWVLGVSLLVLLLLDAFTGYLLPFDALSFEAVSVGRGMAESAPGIGDFVVRMIFGGSEIGDAAILRAYVLHCILLPVLMIGLMLLHFWRVRRDGFKGGL